MTCATERRAVVTFKGKAQPSDVTPPTALVGFGYEPS
jgi:hypothetical protein